MVYCLWFIVCGLLFIVYGSLFIDSFLLFLIQQKKHFQF